MSSFFIVLPSNSRSYGTNKNNKFRVRLPHKIVLDGNYVVALQSIIYPNTWNAIGTDESQFMQIYLTDGRVFKFKIPNGSYLTPEQLAKNLHKGILRELRRVRQERLKRIDKRQSSLYVKEGEVLEDNEEVDETDRVEYKPLPGEQLKENEEVDESVKIDKGEKIEAEKPKATQPATSGQIESEKPRGITDGGKSDKPKSNTSVEKPSDAGTQATTISEKSIATPTKAPEPNKKTEDFGRDDKGEKTKVEQTTPTQPATSGQIKSEKPPGREGKDKSKSNVTVEKPSDSGTPAIIASEKAIATSIKPPEPKKKKEGGYMQAMPSTPKPGIGRKDGKISKSFKIREEETEDDQYERGEESDDGYDSRLADKRGWRLFKTHQHLFKRWRDSKTKDWWTLERLIAERGSTVGIPKTEIARGIIDALAEEGSEMYAHLTANITNYDKFLEILRDLDYSVKERFEKEPIGITEAEKEELLKLSLANSIRFVYLPEISRFMLRANDKRIKYVELSDQICYVLGLWFQQLLGNFFIQGSRRRVKLDIWILQDTCMICEEVLVKSAALLIS